jgi:peptidoglycan/xylan/chitin deacetylase (PgdA/CDA1 family)
MTDSRTLLSRVEHRLRRQLVPGPLVLCFHSIRPEGLPNDAIGAITRSRFSAMLDVIRKVARVVPLQDAVSGRARSSARERCIALTFDDGYRDNLEVALPMLERHDLPATFFITTSMLDQSREYPWDELQQAISNAVDIPPRLRLLVRGREHNWCAASAGGCHGDHRCTRFSSRGELYRKLLQFLNPLGLDAQQDALSQLGSMLGVAATIRPECRTMSAEEVHRLSRHPLATIGSHTVTHRELPRLSREERVRELLQSRLTLESVVGGRIDMLAYPYGGFDSLSNGIATECGYSTTFTIDPRAMRPVHGRMLLPRLMIRAGDFEALEQTLIWMFGT